MFFSPRRITPSASRGKWLRAFHLFEFSAGRRRIGSLQSGMATARKAGKVATVPRFFQPPSTHYFLFGPRGTGKSTWLRETYTDALWVDLLRPEVHRQYAAYPERLRELVAGNP